MTRRGLVVTTALLAGIGIGTASRAARPAGRPGTVHRRPIGWPPITPGADNAFNPMSNNVKVYGSVYSA
jgi:hypothetical protein